MPTANSLLERSLLNALRRISAYSSPDHLRRNSGKEYGLDSAESIEMAYDNVIAEAKNAVRGVRLGKDAANG